MGRASWGGWLALAGVNGFLSVALGAFAAHGLQALGDAHAVELLEKAARYQMIGVLGLVIAAWTKERRISSLLADIMGCAYILGVVLFCGSLVLIALFQAPVAFLAPIGGTSFLVGWLLVAWVGIRAIKRGGV